MEFGIFASWNRREGHTEAEAFDEWLGLAEFAEDIGIDCFWLAEFHFRPRTIVSAPLATAAAIAARTKRMKLGIAVQLLPLANPVRVAEEAATVDHISKGRLIMGVGRSSFVDAYQGYHISYEESRPRFFEALEILRQAWDDEPFTYEGEFWQFHNVNVVPKPYQKPHPPIRIASESRDSFPMMGRLGLPILIRHQFPVDELKGLIDQYHAERAAAGFTGPTDITLQVPVYVAESAEQARHDTEEPLRRENEIMLAMARDAGDQNAYERFLRSRSLTYEQKVQRAGLGAYPNPYLFGTPDELVDRLCEYQEVLGITGISMAVNPGSIAPELIARSLRLLADRVIPRLK